ncbi:F-box/WD repeat-containing protein 7 [Chrysoperla carnea]|uniref:F-box/WD repeat-containing protein 7 n=1 Tax=Chrysoperla carnea TaxID=189513 RepID=UPI001D091E84|nr:F-box/WD repeat-containing protein 7 [Chrysoperla carnea]
MEELCSTTDNNVIRSLGSVPVIIEECENNKVITSTNLIDIIDTKTNQNECTSPSPTETIICESFDRNLEPIPGPSHHNQPTCNQQFQETIDYEEEGEGDDDCEDECQDDIDETPPNEVNNLVDIDAPDNIDVILDNTLNETHERILQDNRTPERRLITISNNRNNTYRDLDNATTKRNQVFIKSNLFNSDNNSVGCDGVTPSGSGGDAGVGVGDVWEEEYEMIHDDDDDGDEDDDEPEPSVSCCGVGEADCGEDVVVGCGSGDFEDCPESGAEEEEEGGVQDDDEMIMVIDSSNEQDAIPSNSGYRRSWRKRKLETQNAFPCKKLFPENKTAVGDDMDSITEKMSTTNSISLSSTEKKHRCVIPTKDNPPPEMIGWLSQFERWSNAERLLAIDELIDRCEPTQVRHMMQVIEPQFQRDFISLLPRELALNVLSFLEPKDLLRAAQTCRSWRYLAEDNLLWREKCRQTGINELPQLEQPLLSTHVNKKHHHRNINCKSDTPPTSTSTSATIHSASPWKAAFMRQHAIEMNWRVKPIRPPKVLKGHDDHVITCLQFCGNRIVSGSDDNTLKVWSAVTGKCLRTLVGHTGGVWSSQMAGSIIISGSTDRTLKVWNAESGVCIHTLYGHTSTVRCMHLYENRVVSGSRDATLRMWDVVSGECLHVLVGHLAAVRCVQYDGRLVVSGAYDYMVKVWNPEREECLHTLQGHTNRVYSLQFDGVHVVSGSLDTSIRVWEVETGACRHTLMGHQSLTSGMELRNNILVSGNADSTVKVWDIVTGQCLQTLSGANKHQSAVTCLQFNNRFVITSSDDGTVKLWDVHTGEFIRNLVALGSGGSGGVVWRIRANDTKLVCAVGSRNGTEETKLLVLDFDVLPPDNQTKDNNLQIQTSTANNNILNNNLTNNLNSSNLINNVITLNQQEHEHEPETIEDDDDR